MSKVVQEDKTARYLAHAIAESFDKLPANIREQLLLKIADKDSVAGIVSSIMKERGNNIPEHIEKEILVKLKQGIK